MRYTIILAAIGLLSCNENEAMIAKRGVSRIALFERCMELAGRMPRQQDDDVADVVSNCSNEANYMTNYIK